MLLDFSDVIRFYHIYSFYRWYYMLFFLQMESGKIPETFLANKTASIVYNNAIQSFPGKIPYIFSLRLS